MKRFSIILTTFLVICFAQTALAQKSFKIGFVRSFDESGDSVWLASSKEKGRVDSKTIARFGNYGDNPSGKININGRDIVLKSTKQFLPDRNFKVGRGGYEIWEGNDTTVRLDYVFTWLCPPQNDNCEVYYFKGVLDIKHGGMRRKVSVRGEGGS